MEHPDAQEKIVGEVAIPSHGQGGTGAGLYAGVAIGIMAAIAVAVALSGGAVIRLRRRHDVESSVWYRGMRRRDVYSLSEYTAVYRCDSFIAVTVIVQTAPTRVKHVNGVGGSVWFCANKTILDEPLTVFRQHNSAQHSLLRACKLSCERS